MIYVADEKQLCITKARRMLYLLGFSSIGGSYRMAYYYVKNGLCDAIFLPRPISPNRPKYFCRSIRSHFPNIPTLMLSGHDYDDLTLKDPADYVVRAPFSPSSALRKMLTFLHESNYKDHGALKVGSLIHKVTNGGFYYAGEYIKLTDTQTAILHTMLDRFPSPLLPKTLLKLSADPRKTPKLHTLSPQICRLNKKFFEQYGFRPISYHPILGYYLSIP